MSYHYLIALTADQAIAAYDATETRADIYAAHRICDAVKADFRDDDRAQVVRAMVAAVSRLKTWRPPAGCTECGP